MGWLIFFLGLSAGNIVGALVMSLLFMAREDPGLEPGKCPARLRVVRVGLSGRH